MEIVVHSKKSLFQQKFQKNCTISTAIPNLGVWSTKWSNWTSGVGQKIRLRLPVLLEIRLQLHPKTSDSLRLRLQLRLRNPAFYTVCENECQTKFPQCSSDLNNVGLNKIGDSTGTSYKWHVIIKVNATNTCW